MATPMQKVTATWTGWSGAPGTTTWWFNGASILAPSVVKAYVDAYLPYIPPAVKIQVNNSGETVDPDTGKVVGTWSGASVAQSVGTGTAGTLLLAQGAQMRIDTGQYRNGKHIRGRQYFIPILAAGVDSLGAISAGVVSAMNAAASTLSASSGGAWGVFHRPVYDHTVKPPVLKRNGEFLSAASFTTMSKVAVLTSRRD